MKNGFVLSEDNMEFSSGPCSSTAATISRRQSAHRSDNGDEEVQHLCNTRLDNNSMISDCGARGFDGQKSISPKTSHGQLDGGGTKDSPSWSTYNSTWLWSRVRSFFQSLKHVNWKNGRAPPGKAYTPTEVC